MQDKKLLTTKEAAEFLNVKISWIRSAVFRKEIPYIKLGHLVRFNKGELHEWVDKKRVHFR